MRGTDQRFGTSKRRLSLRSLLPRLTRDRKGATLIEFALVAGPFIALIVAIIQTSLVFFSQQVLETTAEQTARLIVTNKAQKSGLSQADFKAAACSELPSFMKCADLMIDVRTAASFSNADTAAPTLTYDSTGKVNNSWKYELAGAEKVVVLRLMYTMPVVFGPLGFTMADVQGNRRLLIATSVFQPEPLS